MNWCDRTMSSALGAMDRPITATGRFRGSGLATRDFCLRRRGLELVNPWRRPLAGNRQGGGWSRRLGLTDGGEGVQFGSVFAEDGPCQRIAQQWADGQSRRTVAGGHIDTVIARQGPGDGQAVGQRSQAHPGFEKRGISQSRCDPEGVAQHLGLASSGHPWVEPAAGLPGSAGDDPALIEGDEVVVGQRMHGGPGGGSTP